MAEDFIIQANGGSLMWLNWWSGLSEWTCTSNKEKSPLFWHYVDPQLQIWFLDTITIIVYIYELILESFQSVLRNKGLKETTQILQLQQSTTEFFLCSTHFRDRVLTAPEMLNDTSNDNNYQEISFKKYERIFQSYTLPM